MKKQSALFPLALCVAIGVWALASCGGDDDDDAGTDDDSGDPCAGLPDLVVDHFTVSTLDDAYGTKFNFTEVVLCNYGGAASEPDHRFAFYLMTSADFTGEYYMPYESEPLVGLSPQDCATFTFTMQVGDVPEGYYYVYIVADQDEVIAECDETNNWARSNEPVYVTPDTSEPI